MGRPVMTVPSDALSVTVSGAVAPTATLTGFGLTVTDAMRFVTLKVQRSVPFAFDAVMTAEVRTCGPQDDISEIASIMTHGRFRHLPVVVDGSLVGIVSIGDVVKKRIDQLETETDQLRDYLTS